MVCTDTTINNEVVEFRHCEKIHNILLTWGLMVEINAAIMQSLMKVS
jgi:hypothetical protein